MTDELIKRLRGVGQVLPLAHETADLIEQQTARIAELEASLAKANDAWLALSQVQSSQPVIDKSMVKRLAVQHGLSAGDSGQATFQGAGESHEEMMDRLTHESNQMSLFARTLIYQSRPWGEDHWNDVDREVYDRISEIHRRIVYTAPVTRAAETVPMTDEQAVAFKQWFAENCPEFQRKTYTASDVESNVQSVAHEAWKFSLTQASDSNVRRDALEEAAKACEALEERISNAMVDANERSGTPIDGGYLNACDDCAAAIRALGEPIQGEPT